MAPCAPTLTVGAGRTSPSGPRPGAVAGPRGRPPRGRAPRGRPSWQVPVAGPRGRFLVGSRLAQWGAVRVIPSQTMMQEGLEQTPTAEAFCWQEASGGPRGVRGVRRSSRRGQAGSAGGRLDRSARRASSMRPASTSGITCSSRSAVQSLDACPPDRSADRASPTSSATVAISRWKRSGDPGPEPCGERRAGPAGRDGQCHRSLPVHRRQADRARDRRRAVDEYPGPDGIGDHSPRPPRVARWRSSRAGTSPPRRGGRDGARAGSSGRPGPAVPDRPARRATGSRQAPRRSPVPRLRRDRRHGGRRPCHRRPPGTPSRRRRARRGSRGAPGERRGGWSRP